MPATAWTVNVKNKRKLCESEVITLPKLRMTARALRLKGRASLAKGWASPIIPLLVEHILFEEYRDLSDISDVSVSFREGKDIKLCSPQKHNQQKNST